MLRNFISAMVSNGKTVSGTAISKGMTLAGLFADGAFTGRSVQIQANLPNGTTGLVSSISGGTYVATLLAGGYTGIPEYIGRGIDSAQFISDTTQAGGNSNLTAVFVDTR